jgi:hypothetical protein
MRLDLLARLFTILTLGVALTACFAVMLLSWPERGRPHAVRPALAGCCDVVVTSSIDFVDGEKKPPALPVSAR